jgi:hypothetical protein
MTPGWSRALQTRVDSREAPSSLDTGGVEGTLGQWQQIGPPASGTFLTEVTPRSGDLVPASIACE